MHKWINDIKPWQKYLVRNIPFIYKFNVALVRLYNGRLVVKLYC